MAVQDGKEANQGGRQGDGRQGDGGTLPLLWDGGDRETVEAAREGLYLCFRVSVPLPRKGREAWEREELWRVWLIGEAGETRLGTLEPSGNCLALSRRLSARSLAPLGRLLRCEVRPVSERRSRPSGAGLSGADPSIADLSGAGMSVADQTAVPDILPRPGGGVLLSYPGGGPFPLPELFCFARLDRSGGRECWLFAFDEKGKPVF